MWLLLWLLLIAALVALLFTFNGFRKPAMIAVVVGVTIASGVLVAFLLRTPH